MINVTNWVERKQRYEDYWTMKNKTPLISVTAPKRGKAYDYPQPKDSQAFWFDANWIVGSNRCGNEATYFGGDAFPCVTPSLGPNLISAIMGCEIIYNETSSWVKHWDCPLSEITDFSLDQNNFYFKKMEEILTAFAEDAKNGDYIVGMVDLNTLLDGVSSLIGAQNLCIEMVDNPEEVKRVMGEHLQLYKQIYTYYNNIVTKYQGGNTNWLGIYSEIPWYFISNDFMVMISDDFFEEFTDKPLREMAAFHERVLFHLDGENAAIHLNRILAVKDITGVQVQGAPFSHSAEFWLPHLRNIQASGKTAMIDVRTMDDLMLLVKNLNPEGLYIRTGAETEEEADEIVETVKRYYR